MLGACGAHARALASVVTEADVASRPLASACSELAGQARSLADVAALPAPGEVAAAVAAAKEQVTALVAEVADDARMRPASIAIARLTDALVLLAVP
jgi:hypothetical protein